MTKKNYLPDIKKALESDDFLNEILYLLYDVKDKTIKDVTELKFILDVCNEYGYDPYPFISGERDPAFLHFLVITDDVNEYVSTLPCEECDKKEKKEKRGKVLVFDPLKNPYKN